MIDNYDSFSYNLYQLVGAIDPDIRVIRNDELRIEEIDALHPARIILSPGPGRSEDAGVLIDVVKTLSPRIPTLGVCLGHQAICAAFGATVTYAKELMHGKQSLVHFDTSSRLFQNCPKTAPVARYHSLAADADAYAGFNLLLHDGDHLVFASNSPSYSTRALILPTVSVAPRRPLICAQPVMPGFTR